MGSPSVSTVEASTPAARAERRVDVEPDDIQLGGDAQDRETQGKKQLMRPTGNTTTASNQLTKG